ncbi:serine/arginine repetitive matrix protein 2 [Chelonus insularis]|uniref:serine/arginine repetitive matrix protein 2 n=1 Tax=Chelonus insularis TaxID=460826 RepID=UPI0015885A4C|nr:serine/arginine repetitive matrix protein 2 [Chelonus insularis]
MVKSPLKMEKLVVDAIRNLREAKGSTTKDILNYVMREYNSEPTLERRLRAALKRGLEYGILQKKGAHYLMNDPEMSTEQGPMERGGRRRRRRGRKGKKGRRGRGRRRRGGRRRKGRGKSRGRRRRRSRRRGRGGRSRKRGGVDDIDMLSKEPIEEAAPRTDADGGGQTYERPTSRSRSRQSRSRSRTPSHSRSSGSSDREGTDERQQHD